MSSKNSKYRKKFIADLTLITPPYSLKTYQKTALQLPFKSSFLLYAAMFVISVSLNNIQEASRENPLTPLNFHLYSSFLNSSTWYGRRYYDSSHAPLRETLMEDERDLWRFVFTFKNHLWNLSNCSYLSQTWCSLRNPIGSRFIDWRQGILEDS